MNGLKLLTVFGALVGTQAAKGEGDCECTSCATTSGSCTLGETLCEDDGGSWKNCVVGGNAADCKNYNCNTDDASDCNDMCVAANCGFYSWSCKEDSDVNVCFHEDTLITYKGKDYTLQHFLDGHDECKVPHTPKSRGVVIQTSCNKTLRLTDTHLVATSTGFQTAVSVKQGDILFGDFEGTVECTVESNEKEKDVQRYFGLNCLQSEVLANGLKTSTFGDFHTLPSWYMYYAGKVVGAETASVFGDYIAEWYYAK